MGDDPVLPAELIHAVTQSTAGGSAASGGHNITINHFGRTGMVILVSMIGLALGLSISAVVMMGWGQQVQREQTRIQIENVKNEARIMIEAAEKRTMDMAWLAKQEARIAQDKQTYMQGELSKRGIHISTDGH